MCLKCHQNKEGVLENINNIWSEIMECGTYDFRKMCDIEHMFFFVSTGNYGEGAKDTVLKIFKRFVWWYEVNQELEDHFYFSHDFYKKILKYIEDNPEKSPEEMIDNINNEIILYNINKREAFQVSKIVFCAYMFAIIMAFITFVIMPIWSIISSL